MQETKRHGDAFDYYYSLGDKRNFASVALHCNCSVRAVADWSKAFNWQLRITQRDLDINKDTEKKTNKAIVNTKADYRAGIAKDLEELETIRQRAVKLIGDATEAIEKGAIKISDVKEFDSVVSSLKKLHDLNKDYIKLDLGLVGEDVPDRTDLNIVLKLPGDLNLDDIL